MPKSGSSSRESRDEHRHEGSNRQSGPAGTSGQRHRDSERAAGTVGAAGADQREAAAGASVQQQREAADAAELAGGDDASVLGDRDWYEYGASDLRPRCPDCERLLVYQQWGPDWWVLGCVCGYVRLGGAASA